MNEKEVWEVRDRILKHMRSAWPKLDLRETKFGSGMRKCEDCDEPYCDDCDRHWSDCDCPGPNSEGWYHFTCDGFEYAARLRPDERSDI